MNNEQARQESRRTGRAVLLSLVLLFAVFCSVDAFFVYKALTTHTGVISEHAYEEGLAYNQYIEQAREQDQLYTVISYDDGTVSLQVRDHGKQPLDDAKASLSFVRPVHGHYDFSVDLVNSGAGLYTSRVDMPLKGLWSAKVNIEWQKEQQHKIYQTQLDLIVR